MRLLHKNPAISLRLITSGFQVFKERLQAILNTSCGLLLEDVIDDDSLCIYYRNGDSPEFVAATITGPCFDSDEDDYADAV